VFLFFVFCFDKMSSAVSDVFAEHRMGTTIIACTYRDGVVLGADSRTSTGSYIANRVTNKITPIADKIFVCRSGSASDTQFLSDRVSLDLQQYEMLSYHPATVRVAAKRFREYIYANKDVLTAGVIIAGFDQEANKGCVSTVDLSGALFHLPYAITGSGSTYIYGFCDANFREGMTEQECVDFVRRALSLAMGRDGSSGGVMRTVVVNAQGVKREMVPFDQVPSFIHA